jgi:hypothetical protein
MTVAFVKLYGTRLLRSTLWMESIEARLLFLGMLAESDWEGFVDIPSVHVLAHRMNMTIQQTQDALRVLEGPDAGSRSPEMDGRRVYRDGSGWRIVNAEKYRELRSDRQEVDRARKAEQRAAAKALKPRTVQDMSKTNPLDLRLREREEKDSSLRSEGTRASALPLREPANTRFGGSAARVQTFLDVFKSEAFRLDWSPSPQLSRQHLTQAVARAAEMASASRPFEQAALELARTALEGARRTGKQVGFVLLECEPGKAFQAPSANHSAKRLAAAPAAPHSAFDNQDDDAALVLARMEASQAGRGTK